MAPRFIPYTPDIEVPEPGFEEKLQKVLERMERYIGESVAVSGRAVRDAHAKGYGLVRGEVEILGGLPSEYAQGIYATPGTHDAVIRFSNGSPFTGADARLGAGMGLALKIFDIDGPTLLQDEPDARTFDYTNINGPIFFVNTLGHYLFVQELLLTAKDYFSQGRPGMHRFFSDFLTGKGTLEKEQWAWAELIAFLKLSQAPRVNLLLASYWTMAAVRHGDYVAKVRIAPDPASADAVVQRNLDPTSAEEVVRPALVAELQARPYAFDIQVQLSTDLERMPVEDTTVEWPEQLSPYVTVAKLRIPQQDISAEDNLEMVDTLSFNPWRVTAEHAPLGSIMRARLEVYRHASILRHKLNQQPLAEPRSADELLQKPAPTPSP